MAEAKVKQTEDLLLLWEAVLPCEFFTMAVPRHPLKADALDWQTSVVH